MWLAQLYLKPWAVVAPEQAAWHPSPLCAALFLPWVSKGFYSDRGGHPESGVVGLLFRLPRKRAKLLCKCESWEAQSGHVHADVGNQNGRKSSGQLGGPQIRASAIQLYSPFFTWFGRLSVGHNLQRHS
jgi:hypothetical protein